MSGAGDGDGGAGGESFEARLRAARERQGRPSGVETKLHLDKLPTSALGVGLRVAVELVSALVVGVAIGWALDHFLHTSPVFLALFVLLGGAAGVLNVWRVMGPGRGP